MREKIIEFFTANNLSLIGSGSGLNSVCCTICGFALAVGVKTYSELKEIIKECNSSNNWEEELEKVFKFAKANNYGKMWEEKLKELENK